MSKKPHSIKVPTQYRATAKILKAALEQQKCIKTLIFAEKHARTRSLHTVLKKFSENRVAVEKAIEETGLLRDNPSFDPSLAKILVTELLFARKELNGESKPVQTVRSYKERLLNSIGDFGVQRKEPNPRYVRINTNLYSLAEALEYLYSEDWRRKELPADASYADFLTAIKSLEEDEFMTDLHVEGVLIFPPKWSNYWVRHPLVHDKRFILQNKATCLAAELLAPPTGATVLDMCAAPGMKTVHICNVMQNKGCIYSVEQDHKRYNTLCDITEEAGCAIVKPIFSDALDLTPERFADVEYILVDPSCSGSGMQNRMTVCDEPKDDRRLQKLQGLQIKILSHAMSSFPNVKRIAYCTCSLWKEENEQVVQRCLQLNPSYKLLSCKKALRNKWHNVGDTDYPNIGKNVLYCLPESDLTDGIFLALFEKRREGEID
ncbi:probable 28S rRNA (cytosine-C(5))-methyltransferase [Drosophila mauritiana]|uniref:Probable 28S rRNA (Cytosine-C(5))-methyltransferase n=1 Tax=Drosophila mauritiana TaxID=7226 RepID=A0A6P8KDJ8_DROMA|nr:probable 28S rRNA (cytosine-C(5))-methyltransferase [Drosophila mauritiana]